MYQKKILIIGVPYSDNLGDYIIYDSLYNIFSDRGYAVSALDFSGRKGFESNQQKKGSVAIKQYIIATKINILKFLITPLNALYSAIRNQREFSYKIKNSDYVIIGGGNIFSDNYLNFPLKLWFIYKLLLKHEKKYSIVSVGIGNNWSFLAKYIYSKIIKNSTHFSVRDKNSKLLAISFLGLFPSSLEVIPDPAISISNYYPAIDIRLNKKVIGINIVNWNSIFFGSDNAKTEISFDPILLYKMICKYYLDKKFKIILFTNGSIEDNASLHELKEKMKGFPEIRNITFSATSNHNSLINTIKKLDLLISSRLHASIIATSYSIPSICFSWDSKVTSFYSTLESKKSAIYLDGINDQNLESFVSSFDNLFVDKNKLDLILHKMKGDINYYMDKIKF